MQSEVKCQGVQWDPQRVQLHPVHPSGYRPGRQTSDLKKDASGLQRGASDS